MNAINIIRPYKYLGTWVFDDSAEGLVQEAFVAGADDVMDKLSQHLPDAENGFLHTFLGHQFPGFQYQFDHLREEMDGNTYLSKDLGLEGWLCPALFKYFDATPEHLYVKVEPLKK